MKNTNDLWFCFDFFSEFPESMAQNENEMESFEKKWQFKKASVYARWFPWINIEKDRNKLNFECFQENFSKIQ